MNVGEQHAESVWVMGAGSVGCWVGGRLAAAGARVHFIGRPRVVEVLRTEGLTLSDVEGPTLHVAPDALDALDASELPPDGAAPGLVLLAVKSAGTEAATATGARAARGHAAAVVANGVDKAARAQAVAPQLRVVPAMVPSMWPSWRPAICTAARKGCWPRRTMWR